MNVDPIDQQEQSALRNCAGADSRHKRPRFGQILVEAELLEAAALHRCLRTARRTGQMLGAVLLRKQLISTHELESALTAQKFIEDVAISDTAVTKILKQACQNQTDMISAIQNADSLDDRAYDRERYSIEELPKFLIESALLKPAMVKRAREMSAQTSMTLCKTLLLENVITIAALDAVLRSIMLVRAGSISSDQAIKALRQKKNTVTRSHCRLQSDKQRTLVTLGEMLVYSKCLTEFESVSATEKALASHSHLEHILVKSGLIAQAVIEDALVLQEFVELGVLTIDEAVLTLTEIDQSGNTLKMLSSKAILFQITRTQKKQLSY